MRKKFLLGVLLALSTAIHPVSAQEVTVVGMGADRESAIRDASRNAVSQVVGTLIDSTTLVEQAIVELDEIYAKSQGFVKNIAILSEGKSGNDYRVQARIDVDTNPDAKLMSNLAMLLMLNDPRIAVIVLSDGATGSATAEGGEAARGEHDTISETAMNDRLGSLGFSHVVDADHVIKLQDAKLLNSIYNGQRGLEAAGMSDHAIDYLVLGKSKVDAYKITLPGAAGTERVETPLTTVRAQLGVKILKYDTGDLVGNFTVEGQGIENNTTRASGKALQAAAEKAAQKLEEKFKKFGSRATQGIQVTATAQDYGKIEQLARELRALGGINEVYIRSHDGNQAILEIDSVQKPHIIVQRLKERNKLGIFVENISNSSIKLNLS